eukprot:350847-Chlamydomonas_euryale.AAC.3
MAGLCTHTAPARMRLMPGAQRRAMPMPPARSCVFYVALKGNQPTLLACVLGAAAPPPLQPPPEVLHTRAPFAATCNTSPCTPACVQGSSPGYARSTAMYTEPASQVPSSATIVS